MGVQGFQLSDMVWHLISIAVCHLCIMLPIIAQNKVSVHFQIYRNHEYSVILNVNDYMKRHDALTATISWKSTFLFDRIYGCRTYLPDERSHQELAQGPEQLNVFPTVPSRYVTNSLSLSASMACGSCHHIVRGVAVYP
jgi:hypothetical protein